MQYYDEMKLSQQVVSKILLNRKARRYQKLDNKND